MASLHANREKFKVLSYTALIGYLKGGTTPLPLPPTYHAYYYDSYLTSILHSVSVASLVNNVGPIKLYLALSLAGSIFLSQRSTVSTCAIETMEIDNSTPCLSTVGKR